MSDEEMITGIFFKTKKISSFIASLEAGVSVNSEDRPTSGDELGILKTSSIWNGKFYPKENKKILSEDIDRATLNPRAGAVIISRMNTPKLVGEVGYIDQNYPNLFLPDRLWQTNFSQQISGKWFASLLSLPEYRSMIKRIASGTSNSMKNISKKCFLELEVPYPSYKEQLRIEKIICSWDRAIELKEELIEQKKLRKNGLAERLLTGKVRLPGFNDKWYRVQLKDVFDRVIRRNDTGCKNVLTISAQKGLIKQGDYFNKTIASEVLDHYYLLKQGEFAYNKSYSNGYPMGAIKRLNQYSEGVVTTLYICFKLKNDEHSSEYFEQFFENGNLNHILTRITQEGARAHGLLNISPNDFFAIRILIPSKEEQIAIASVLVQSDEETNLLKQELEYLKTQKNGLMQLLLTGKVRISDV